MKTYQIAILSIFIIGLFLSSLPQTTHFGFMIFTLSILIGVGLGIGSLIRLYVWGLKAISVRARVQFLEQRTQLLINQLLIYF